MEFGFRVESAKVKREHDDDDVPVHVPMAPRSADRRNPSTDQKKIRRQLSKKADASTTQGAPMSLLTARFQTVAGLHKQSAFISYTSVDAAFALLGKVSREWGDHGYSVQVEGIGSRNGIVHVRHSDGSTFALTSDRYGNVTGPHPDETLNTPYASMDAAFSALSYLSREWGDYGYSVALSGDGSGGAVLNVTHSDGSEFDIRTDRYGNVAKTAAKTAGMGEEDEDDYNVDGGYADCPACGGVGNLMGQLGGRAWYRCRDCGTTFDGAGKTARRKTAVTVAEVDKAWTDLENAFEDSGLNKFEMNEIQQMADGRSGEPDWQSDEPGELGKQMRSIELMRKLIQKRSSRKTAGLTCPTCGEPVEPTPSSGMYRHVNSLTGPCGIRLMDSAMREDGSYTDDEYEDEMESTASRKTARVNWTEEAVPMQLYPGLSESVVVWSAEMMGVIAQIASVRGGFNWYVYSSDDEAAPELDSGVEVSLAAAQAAAEASLRANTTQMSLFSARKNR